MADHVVWNRAAGRATRARFESIRKVLGKAAGHSPVQCGHSVFDEWVYNAAHIDKAPVVWAREMDRSSNFDLLKYFRDRTAWLIEPDIVPARITPYRLPDQ